MIKTWGWMHQNGRRDFININLPIDTTWYGWECYIPNVVLFCNPQTIPVNQFDNTKASIKCDDSEPKHKTEYTFADSKMMKSLPVSTCQRGSRITISIVDWANSMNNMRSRQLETTAHQQVQGLYETSFQLQLPNQQSEITNTKMAEKHIPRFLARALKRSQTSKTKKIRPRRIYFTSACSTPSISREHAHPKGSHM